MKTIAVYPGRFQPFHKGHAQVYKWLKSKFGNATIATSNKVEAPKSPFTFTEKKKMMELSGVTSTDIHEVRNPYISSEILRGYDGSKTIVVFAVSQKDMDEDPRFSFKPTKSGQPSYLQPYPKDGKGAKPFGDPDKPKAYVIVTPTFDFEVLGEPARSATEVRKQFANADHGTQIKIIKDLFGKYDKGIHKVMDEKIKGALASAPKPVSIKKIRAKLKEEEETAGQYFTKNPTPKNPVNDFLDNNLPVISQAKTALGVVDKIKNKDYTGAALDVASQVPKVGAAVGVGRALGAIREDSVSDIGDLNHEKFGPMLDTFTQFASKKLGIKSLPKMRLEKEPMTNSFGGYNPGENSIVVISKNRHPMDVFRTVAHELVHHKQNEDGRLGKDISKEGSTGSDIENEANSEAGKIMRWFAKSNPQMFKSGYVTEETIAEGINDPGTFKAVFLAGGPGSGKDYVMKQTLAGMGLQEINSDVAFEFLMRKAGLDFKMPENERFERDIVRGRGKNISVEQQRLAMAGRRGVIINGTADDPEKIALQKKTLEDAGYDTMMVFVNTSDEVSKERNLDRGRQGGRAVPEDIRKDKWEACQAALPVLAKLFGKDNFVAVDNSNDLRTAPPEVKKKVEGEFQNIFKMTKKFVARQPNDNPAAAAWNQSEMQRRNMQSFVPPSTTAFGTGSVQRGAVQASDAIPADQDNVQQVSQAPSPNEMSQAKRLGLTYYGFGRYGTTIKGKHTVTYITQNGKLVPKQRQIAEDLRKWFSKTDPEGGWKRINSKGEAIGPCAREPGEPKPKCMSNEKRAKLTKKERASAVRAKRRNDPNPERKGEPINVSNFGKGKIGEACWDGYTAKGMKKKGNKMVPNCVPEKKYLEEKNVPTNPSLWSQAKSMARSKFDVYPSAYANGWASKWYKSKGGGWKTQADESFENMVNENTPSDREWGKDSLTKIYKENTPGQSFPENPLSEKIRDKVKKKKLAQEDNAPPLGYEFGRDGIGQEFGVVRSPTGYGGGYSLPMSESVAAWANKEETIERFITKYGEQAEQKLYEACQRLSDISSSTTGPKGFNGLREAWEAIGGRDMATVMKTSKDDVDESSPAWQRKEGKNPTGGLNKKGIASYRRENPGSKLSLAVTTKPSKLKPGSKAANRRKSFCARMGGMRGPMKDEKGRPTRKALSLRKWNCEE
jgi:cytidyltransferase-like protein